VSNIAAGAFSPDWSPSGDTLIFSSYTADGNPQLFTMPVAGGEPTQLTSTQVFKAFPRWAPDGSAIAYVGTILVPAAARIDGASEQSRAALLSRLHNVGVYTAAADGTHETLITDLVQDAWLLGWCTAGPWLASGWTQH
jgi:Tol biopolymer transport system component